ncbi:MAG TPA: MFS transporter [Blastocatellia bacterium]|nr:MFS transporter [Blastocatellia bacterium]
MSELRTPDSEAPVVPVGEGPLENTSGNSGSAVLSDLISTTRPTRRRFQVMSLLSVMYLITYMDRTNLSIIAPLISKEFKFDKLTMGYIFSAFSWSYTIFQMPCGYLGDRFGPRRTLSVFAFYWSILTSAIVGARSALGFWVYRFFFGIGEAGAFPTATRAMTHWFPPTERGFAQGITHAFSRLGSALTPLVTVAVAGRYGWRAAFWMFGIVGVVWSIAWFAQYRDRPELDPRVNEAELLKIRHGSQGRATVGAKAPLSIPTLLASPNMWAINIQYFAYGYSLWFYLTWLPTYFIEVRHFDFIKTGIYSSLPFLAGMVGDTLGGFLCDYIVIRTGNLKLSRSGVGAIAMLATVVFLIPGAMTGRPWLAVTLLSVAAFFLEMNIGPAWAVVMDVGHENAGVVSGMMNMCGSLAGALSPIIFAWVWQHTGSAVLPFMISGSLMAIGATAWAMIDPRKPVAVGSEVSAFLREDRDAR